MKVVIAPDSFKGTATAAEAADALAAGWQLVRPDDELVRAPMADGGEGTLATLVAACPGATRHSVPDCAGPDGQPVTGEFAMLPDGCAVVDIATASGLPLMGTANALTATSRGTGQLIAAAIDHGATRLVVGLGGSACTDGGVGILAALGARFTDTRRRTPRDGGGSLEDLARVDLSELRPPPPGGVTLLTDVRNPLLGAEGAAAVYGPQKGARPTDIARLDLGLARLRDLLGGDPDRSGMGAAGGAAYGLATAWGAVVVPGAAAVADLIRLDQALDGADLVITGEGRYDRTSLLGKVVGEVLARAARVRVPVRVVAGDSTDPRTVTLTRIAGSTAAARRDAPSWLRHAAAAMARDLIPARS